ncbi:unnamed protein product [Phytomonas sp. Hart1]|nr:unnamed protein product [Phytomonas sp. Hart1]|eukprot:CCW68115.1 unnamed protein product [Phytomonas sp. isolate Hart1]
MPDDQSSLESKDISQMSEVYINENYFTYRRLVRAIVCGFLFGLGFCVATPASPLMQLSLTEENKKGLIPRIMKDFFYLSFTASSLAYWCVVEPSITNPKAKEGFTPYLGPLTAEIPAFSCLVLSHLYYPGIGALVNETTWREKRREFMRLNLKCFFAYAPVHIPATLLIGATLGLIMYPFKLMKLYSYKKKRQKIHC